MQNAAKKGGGKKRKQKAGPYNATEWADMGRRIKTNPVKKKEKREKRQTRDGGCGWGGAGASAPGMWVFSVLCKFSGGRRNKTAFFGWCF
jgi:hypothetical protein